VSNYRRNYVPGGTYFLTLVTHQRRPLFEVDSSRKLLHDALHVVNVKRPFTIVAMVLLPDHLHCVWTLPMDDDDYSTRIRQVKEQFTREFLRIGGQGGDTSTSRLRSGERAVWQRRFWEHTCTDHDDPPSVLPRQCDPTMCHSRVATTMTDDRFVVRVLPRWWVSRCSTHPTSPIALVIRSKDDRCYMAR
jgi:REP element-mobilizing transposase RayT